jgi:hypothetical protein
MGDPLTPRSREVVLSNGPSEAIEYLVAGFADPVAKTAINFFLLDRSQGRLIVLDWLPGRGLAARMVALADTWPDGTLLGSVDGSTLAVSGETETCLVHHETGAVYRIKRFETPAVISPGGRRLIAATDRGLITLDLWSDSPERPPFAAGINPLAVAPLDNPNAMHVLPGRTDDAFTLVIGGYGEVNHAMISRIGSSWPDVDVEQRSTAPLPYDPVYLAVPMPIAAEPDRHFLYASDEGRAGLLAINVRFDLTHEFPFAAAKTYGRVRGVRPSLDGLSCLVRVKTGETLFWQPGTEPRAIDLAGGLPLAWHLGHALWLDESGGKIEETPFNP